MKKIILNLKEKNQISIEFDNILPELLYDKTSDQINKSIVFYGNKQKPLSYFFEVDVIGKTDNPNECSIIINGDTSRIKRIGYQMSCGNIVVNGDVDFHVGAKMSGGHIVVNGDAGSYAGREMKGGLLEIKGNVREFCGSAYSGEWRGMSGGKIIISGNVGKHLADYMLGGEIYVRGNCDILAGVHMVGGFIQIEGNVKQWLGGQIKKGTIIVTGNSEKLLPGFISKEKIHNPLINDKYYFGVYKLFIGDKGVKGKANLWIKQ